MNRRFYYARAAFLALRRLLSPLNTSTRYDVSWTVNGGAKVGHSAA
jgi:hypothetical protein